MAFVMTSVHEVYKTLPALLVPLLNLSFDFRLVRRRPVHLRLHDCLQGRGLRDQEGLLRGVPLSLPERSDLLLHRLHLRENLQLNLVLAWRRMLLLPA